LLFRRRSDAPAGTTFANSSFADDGFEGLDTSAQGAVALASSSPHSYQRIRLAHP